MKIITQNTEQYVKTQKFSFANQTLDGYLYEGQILTQYSKDKFYFQDKSWEHILNSIYT